MMEIATSEHCTVILLKLVQCVDFSQIVENRLDSCIFKVLLVNLGYKNVDCKIPKMRSNHFKFRLSKKFVVLNLLRLCVAFHHFDSICY